MGEHVNDQPVNERPKWVRDAARGEILARHARLTRGGRPIFCAPSRAEIRGAAIPRQTRGTDGKVIYDSREEAEAAARELEDLGARPLRSYLCGRSRHGHFHLTTDGARLPRTLPTGVSPVPAAPAIPQQRTPGARTLHDLIPQQRRPLSA